MPIYTVVQPVDPSSMYAEKFLVSLPVLLTLMTSFVFVLTYAVCWILEFFEEPEPETTSDETQSWRETDDDEAEMYSQEQEQEHEERKQDDREVRNFSSTGKQKQQQRSWKADLLAGKGFHVGNPRRPFPVTSAGSNERVVDDDVTAVIPTRTLPNISVQVTVAFGAGGEEKPGAVVKRCAGFGQRHCFGRCPCGGGGLSQDIRGDAAFAAELERSLRRISTLRLGRQVTELESVVGQIRTLLARLRATGSTDHQGCSGCDEEAERFSVHEDPDPDPEEFSLPEHRNSHCGNDDDDDEGMSYFEKILRERKLRQCTCRMEPDGSDVGHPASHGASEQETTRSQASDVNRDRITGAEATNSSKATPHPHTSRSFTHHVTTDTGNRPESSNPYDPVIY